MHFLFGHQRTLVPSKSLIDRLAELLFASFNQRINIVATTCLLSVSHRAESQLPEKVFAC